MSDQVITANKTEPLRQGADHDHILIDVRAVTYCNDLAIILHHELREAGLLYLANPEDDVPYSAAGSSHRNRMEAVARRILEGIQIEVEMEQLE